MPRVNVKDRRRQQLIEDNMASISRRGLTETTIAHVSKGADMSRGIVNFYFTSKEIMMQETLKFLCEEFTQHWQHALFSKVEKQGENTPSEELLQVLIEANFDPKVCGHKRLTIWSAFWGHACTHKAYAKLIQECDEQHISQIAELWDDICAERSAKNRAQTNFPQQLHSMLRGMWLMLLLEPDIYDAKTLHMMAQRTFHEKLEFISVRSSETTAPAQFTKETKKPVEAKADKKNKKPKDKPEPDVRQIDMFS